MAALRPCPSTSSSLVVGASHLNLITLSPRIVRSVGRRGSASLLNLRTSTAHLLRHRHAIAAQKGAGRGQNPDYEKRVVTNSALPASLSLISRLEHISLDLSENAA
ncbi:unnamed protein product [Urochloa humidicola]